MINENTNSVVLSNTETVASVLSQPNTNGTTLDNKLTNLEVIDNLELPNARVEGLWVDLIVPWDIDAIWSYVSLIKSNVILTNV